MKQLESDPWKDVESRFAVGQKLTGEVTNITDYGAFVDLGEGIEGLVHVSEMSWTKKNVHPGKIVSTSQDVEVMVLEIDAEKRRISLGLKQCTANPWQSFAENHKAGDVLEGEIRNITEFGLFVAIGDEIDGMVHMSDLSWEDSGEDAIKTYNKGESLKVKILEIDPDKERVALGVKQLTEDPFAGALDGVSKGSVVTCKITTITDNGIEVQVNDNLTGFIKKVDLARERSEQRPDRYAVDEKVDAKIMKIDASNRKLSLSIKAREIEEDKKAMADYGSSDSGASLGDILGAALKQKEGAGDEAPAAEEKKAAKKPAAKKAAPKKAAPKKAAAKKTEKAEDKAEDKAEKSKKDSEDKKDDA
jgi:small subunit ribosomal protein S1